MFNKLMHIVFFMVLIFQLVACDKKKKEELESTDPVYETYLYVSNAGEGSLSVFKLEETSGEPELTLVQTYSTGASSYPWGLKVDKDGKYLYATLSGMSAGVAGVSNYAIDATTGTLSAGHYVENTSQNPSYSLDFSHDGQFAFSANYGTGMRCTSYTIASDKTMTETHMISSGNSPTHTVVHPNLDVVYQASFGTHQIFTFSYSSNGTLTEVEQHTSGGNSPTAIAVHPAGKVAVSVHNGVGSTIASYTVNLTTGSLTDSMTATSNGVSNSFPQFVVMHPTLNVFYVVNNSAQNVTAHAIDPDTAGFLQMGTPQSTGSAPWSAAIDPTGKFLIVTNHTSDNLSIFKIDATTGALSPATTATVSVGDDPRFISFVRLLKP